MSVRKRLVTVLTFNNGILFRTKDFHPDYRYTASFVDAWSVDEIVLLDVTREGEGNRENFYSEIEKFAEKCFVPLAVGGHIKTVDEIKRLMNLGADKVIINTEAFRNPALITESAKAYGSQCVVVSIDAIKNSDGSYETVIAHGKEKTGMSPQEWAIKAEEYGAGEILVQSVERDGSLMGYDLDLCREVTSAVNLPVLVNTGAGAWKHFVEGIEKGGASAVCTGNIYHFTQSSIKSAKAFLVRAGMDVRA